MSLAMPAALALVFLSLVYAVAAVLSETAGQLLAVPFMVLVFGIALLCRPQPPARHRARPPQRS